MTSTLICEALPCVEDCIYHDPQGVAAWQRRRDGGRPSLARWVACRAGRHREVTHCEYVQGMFSLERRYVHIRLCRFCGFWVSEGYCPGTNYPKD